MATCRVSAKTVLKLGRLGILGVFVVGGSVNVTEAQTLK